jgi:hypothetical protein
VFCDKPPLRRSALSNELAIRLSRALSSSLCAQLIDAPAERVPQKRLGPVLQLPTRHRQLNGSHDGLKVKPEGLVLLVDTIDDI